MDAAPAARPASFRDRLRPYRFLITVYSVVAVAAAWEVLHRDERVDLVLDPQHNFTDTVATLYPDLSGVHQLRTTQLMLCMSAQHRGLEDAPACRQFARANPMELAREHFEAGRQTGKHIEELYYDYVQFLQASQAPRWQVDAAYRDWRRNFPLSQRPDPRSGAPRP